MAYTDHSHIYNLCNALILPLILSKHFGFWGKYDFCVP